MYLRAMIRRYKGPNTRAPFATNPLAIISPNLAVQRLSTERKAPATCARDEAHFARDVKERAAIERHFFDDFIFICIFELAFNLA
jgi:hypothetical protein